MVEVKCGDADLSNVGLEVGGRRSNSESLELRDSLGFTGAAAREHR